MTLRCTSQTRTCQPEPVDGCLSEPVRERIKLMSYEDEVAQLTEAIAASKMSLAEQGFAVAL